MGQKTHPIGFRIGINSKSSSPAYSINDLHGLTSRWVIPNNKNINNYSDLSSRDILIKRLIEELTEEDGFLVNKVIIQRSNSYIGIYIDAIKLEEPIHYQISDSISVSKNKISINMNRIEKLISHNIEYNCPVFIQFVNLTTKINKINNSIVSKNENDILKVIYLLTKDCIPCSSLLAKIITINRSFGGRRERQTMRFIRKNMNEGFKSAIRSNNRFKGYIIKFKGRIGGSERSRTIQYRSGSLPRHTVSASIDYGFSEVNSISGKISVTVLSYFSLF